jgi:colanic acid/amylovoran biosynthesis glycosyltransferase
MRIAFFVPSFPEVSETFILRQVVGLLDRRHEVRIFAYRPATRGPVQEAVKAYRLDELVRVLPNRRDAVNGSDPSRDAAVRTARRWPRPSARVLGCLRQSYADRVGGWRTLVRTLAALGDERPFDVVHCHYGDIGLRYAVAARLWRAPLVVSFYGHDCSAVPRERGARVFEPLFAEADAVAVLSDHMAARLRMLGCPPALLRRVPLAVDPDIRKPRLPVAGRAAPRLLTVARLAEKKGLEFALRALGLVRDEFPEVQLEIVGAGPLLEELRELARTLGVENHVHFAGARTQEYVGEALRRADVFLLPSVTAANGDEEGTPTVLLEAALCGIPVLSTVHAGIPEIVQDGESGYLVPERDAEALAARLRTLLRAPERWPAMGEAGQRYVETHHVTSVVAERLEQVYAGTRRSGSRPARERGRESLPNAETETSNIGHTATTGAK